MEGGDSIDKDKETPPSTPTKQSGVNESTTKLSPFSRTIHSLRSLFWSNADEETQSTMVGDLDGGSAPPSPPKRARRGDDKDTSSSGSIVDFRSTVMSAPASEPTQRVRSSMRSTGSPSFITSSPRTSMMRSTKPRLRPPLPPPSDVVAASTAPPKEDGTVPVGKQEEKKPLKPTRSPVQVQSRLDKYFLTSPGSSSVSSFFKKSEKSARRELFSDAASRLLSPGSRIFASGKRRYSRSRSRSKTKSGRRRTRKKVPKKNNTQLNVLEALFSPVFTLLGSKKSNISEETVSNMGSESVSPVSSGPDSPNSFGSPTTADTLDLNASLDFSTSMDTSALREVELTSDAAEATTHQGEKRISHVFGARSEDDRIIYEDARMAEEVLSEALAVTEKNRMEEEESLQEAAAVFPSMRTATDEDVSYAETEVVEGEEEEEFVEFDPYLFIASLPSQLSNGDMIEAPRNLHLPRAPRGSPPISLVLDLDETLIHASTDILGDADVVLPVVFNGVSYQIYVKKRPHFDKFLDHVSRRFEIIVFTASQRVYAEKLLNVLDPGRKWIQHRLFRDACATVAGNYLKDLNVLGRDLSKVVIVDNSPQAFALQLNNGIPIESWFDDKDDRELLNLIPFLDSLHGISDVRPCVEEKFKLFGKVKEAANQAGLTIEPKFLNRDYHN